MHKAIGDPDTEEGLKLVRERSPLFQAHRISKPLLIGQGANDPRVKQAESDQMVATLKEKDIPVGYFSFPTRAMASRGPKTRSLSTPWPKLSSHVTSAADPSRFIQRN